MKCPNCGAEGEKGKYCEYCGIKLPEDPVVINITNNYYGDAPDETPQRKPEQVKESKEEPKPKSSKKGCIWWFLAICFWPFFLTYWFLNTDKVKMEKKTRIIIVVIAWILLFAYAGVSEP